MDPRRLRFIVAGLLFLGWIGYLGFLVARTRNPVVLSRSQLLVSDLVVEAEVAGSADRPESLVKVKAVPFALVEEDRGLAGKDLALADLPDSGIAQGWSGPGTYLLPLRRQEIARKVRYEVASLPPTPGFYYRFVDLEPDHLPGGDMDFAGPVLIALLARGGLPGWETTLWPPLRDRRRAVLTRKIFDTTEGKAPSNVRKRNVPFEKAKTQRRELEAVGIPIRLTPSETRIYPATADTRGQLEKFVGK